MPTHCWLCHISIADDMLGINTTLSRADNFDKSVYRVHNSKFQLIQIIVTQVRGLAQIDNGLAASHAMKWKNHFYVKFSSVS